MANTFLAYLAAAIMLFATSAVSQEIAVGCSLKESDGAPEVQFSGVQGEVDTKNFAESGNISVTARITALDGSIFIVSRSLIYSRVGNRLELPFGDGMETLPIPVTMEQFQTKFGLFPSVNCVTP